jgi:hypothetical protein
VACSELCMNTIAATFFANAQKGIVLYEPFGGLCAGLEMVLRCGIPVTRYLYSDIDPVAQDLAQVRMETLNIQYGKLLPAKAIRRPFALPHDINLVTSDHLLKQDACDQTTQWMTIASRLGMSRPQPSWSRERISWTKVIYLLPTHQLVCHATIAATYTPTSILV